jgi:hypothetical protein
VDALEEPFLLLVFEDAGDADVPDRRRSVGDRIRIGERRRRQGAHPDPLLPAGPEIANHEIPVTVLARR